MKRKRLKVMVSGLKLRSWKGRSIVKDKGKGLE